MAIGFAAVALLVYLVSNPEHANTYVHYVWQADAWLHGRAEITWPVHDGPAPNDRYHDVLPVPGRPGLGQIAYPPLPALVLLPFVAIFGIGIDAELIAAVIGAINAALAWLVASRVASRPSTAFAAAVFFSFGTVAWIAAARGTTWYLAHDVAITCTFGAILATLSIRDAPGPGRNGRRSAGRAFAGGLLLGLATLARLTAVFGAPFLFLANAPARETTNEARAAPRDRRTRLAQAARAAAPSALGLAIPIAALLAYNIASTGHFFQPAYEELYRTETTAIESLRHLDWNIVDPRYIPQNVAITLFEPPALTRRCSVLPTTLECPDATKTLTLTPDRLGMSLLLTSPGWLIALAALRLPMTRLSIAVALAVGAIAVADLMHFSQGWVQFGFRFSNDWAPFGLILVTLGLERLGLRRWTLGLIAASVVVVAWGAAWLRLFGW